MFELHALGTVALGSAGEEPIDPGARQPKRLALLAYLLLARPRGLHRREMLVPLFWPETEDRRARNALSQALHGLRSGLGSEVFQSRGREEIGLLADAFRCDAIAFETHLDAGELVEALGCYAGELLRGLHVPGALGYERWLDQERARFRRRARDAASTLADREEAAGHLVAAARWLERGMDISPGDEALFRRLASLLDEAGDRAGALHAYDRFSVYLRRQFDAEPCPETERLMTRIRARKQRALHTAGTSPEVSRPPVRSLAVLPLQNLTGDASQQYFADGMTDAVIGELARLDGVRVISRQSVTALRGSKQPLREIAEQLGVDAIVEGSVLRTGDHVRVSAQLVRADPEEHLWADAYTRELSDVLALQRDLAHAIARRIGSRLAVGEAPVGERPVDPVAYDQFLRGVVRFPSTSSDGTFEEVLHHLEHAAELDPRFAEPHAWIAFTWCNAVYVGVESYGRGREQAEPSARRALELAPEVGAVHAVLATVLMCFERDWPAVDRSFRAALRLRGGDVRSYAAYPLFLGGMGRFDEAIEQAEELARADPLGPPAQMLRGWALHKARRFDEAVEQLDWTFETWPEYLWTPPFLAASQLFAGRPDQAVNTCRMGRSAVPNLPPVLAYFAATLARAGERSEAASIVAGLEDLSVNAYVDPFSLAVAHAGLDDREAALHQLGRVVSEGSALSFAIPTEPFFDALRDDPGFVEVLKRLRLPTLEL